MSLRILSISIRGTMRFNARLQSSFCREEIKSKYLKMCIRDSNCPTRTRGAAKVADSKPCTLQRLTALAVHLADDDCGKGRVLKGQHLALATGDEAFLRGRLLDGIPGRRFQFRYLVPAILDLGENDFSACVRKVSAEVIELAGVGMVATIPDLELSALDGIAGDTCLLYTSRCV